MQRVENSIARSAKDAAEALRRLDPGQLADCRRMDHETACSVFWRLVARHPDTIGSRDAMRQWIEIVRILAILTPRGEPAKRKELHDRRRPLGKVLCDGGDPTWPPNPQHPSPVFSERRLAQLIAVRGEHRATLLRRAVQMIARSRAPASGVDVVDIARFLLLGDNGRRLAEPYYRRLDRAEQMTSTTNNGAN